MKIKSTVWQVLAAGSFGAGLLYALGIEGTAQVGGVISDGQFITAMVLILLALFLMRLGFAAETREQAAQRKRLLHAQWQARHKEEIRSLTPRPSSAASRLLQAEARDIAFRADVRAADAAGLSYGQYMARKASKKPAGVGAPTSCKG